MQQMSGFIDEEDTFSIAQTTFREDDPNTYKVWTEAVFFVENRQS
jgi:hypothetical protein